MLEIHLSGTCDENVVLDRGNVHILAAPGATLRGGLRLESALPSVTAGIGGPVRIEGLTILNAPELGLLVAGGRVLDGVGLQILDSGTGGAVVANNAVASCRDCTIAGSGTTGLSAFSGASVVLVGQTSISDNGEAGALVGNNASLEMGTAGDDGSGGHEVVLDRNGGDGITVYDGGSLFTFAGSALRLRDNGTAPGSFGSGLLVGTGASALLNGSTEASRNDVGLFVVAGKALIFGPLVADANDFGLFTRGNGALRLLGAGPHSISASTFGVLARDGTLELANVTFGGSSVVDINLAFGAQVRYLGPVVAASVFCDGTVLTTGVGPACP
ncbi:MAG TPA: right-handed parallel beta-helix repeat-containing protein [Pseudomonadales bacterium]|nr:right-handed parallel beta-helix repeat-containing protein [Pseudomonadales bacterium]